MNSQRAEKNFGEVGLDNESGQNQAQSTRHHWRQLFPSEPLWLCTCPLTRSLTSFLLQQRLLSGRIILRHTAFSGLINKDTLCLVLAQFKENVCHPFPFVRSFFFLPYCSYKTYRWVDECIVLLLLTCLRFYGFAVSMFGTGIQTWFKEKKKKKMSRSILNTM